AALSRAGYRLALVARTEVELQQTAESAGGGLVITADVSRAEDVERAVGRALAVHGRIDAIVHCAGFAPARPIREMSVAEWHAVVDTNLSAAFYLLHFAWDAFARQGG